ncbi:MAG TPA: NAD(P)/FAD-dependent oxidoreductase [Desulfobulbus sp.]|nr:NAD(P)/FAD-dependent oxidoreductase [Desulfobulbus sp.]
MSDFATDVLIIGGGPGGLLSGLTTAQYWPGKRITMIRMEKNALIPCGIPYIFGTLGGIDKDLLPGAAQLQAAGINLRIGRVSSIDRGNRVATMENGDHISYERLVLSTGSEPFVPPIPGRDLEGVFIIHKNYSYLHHLFQEVIPGTRRLVIIGGGFIGVEFAEEIRKLDIEVHIVEKMPHLLATTFDKELYIQVEQYLAGKGIHVHCHRTVQTILAAEDPARVGGVLLEGGERIEADAVLIAIGVRPRNELAKTAGLRLGSHGAVLVDGFQRTLDAPEIFAVGDCAEKEDFFTRREGGALLASQAAAEGRIAGMNMYALQLLRHNAGSVAVYAGMVGDLAFGAAGMTAEQARRTGFSILVGEARGLDHYPPAMPDTHEVYCRLIFARESLRLLGGQILGGPTTGELANEIGFLIQNRVTATEIASFQTCMHPRLTASAHPITEATTDVLRQHLHTQAMPG